MSFEKNKQNVIADTKALIELGVDRKALLISIERGEMDDEIAISRYKRSGD